ncbi:hypothetical protein FSP39_021099 [Pinctada imbricata]|uniref:TFIID subunit TAF5 NTD2 domain-containing protein n=1 Tax=Pinctada imbricata TaxID=66713 RepID=A0AA89C0Q6_PINIB|nr:hypothetical protein FSP39_021099 [Pinctada imbricata]
MSCLLNPENPVLDIYSTVLGILQLLIVSESGTPLVATEKVHELTHSNVSLLSSVYRKFPFETTTILFSVSIRDLETASKKEGKWMQSISDMALKNSTNGETTVENVLALSSISGDATGCEQQFNRLKNFINEAVEPYREELQLVLYPMFVQICLQVLCNGHKAAANKFYSRHVKLFENNTNYAAMLDSLQKLNSRDDVSGCLRATDFRENKYTVNLSEEALDYLKRHLKLEDNMMLLQVFNQHVKVEISGEEKRDYDLREGTNTADKDTKGDNSGSNMMLQLQQAIKNVRQGPLCAPSICFYTFLNAHQGLCTVDISANKTLLSAGFEDSSIKLWSITPGMIQSKPAGIDPSKIYIAADYWRIEDHTEDDSKVRYEEVVTMRGHSGTVYKTCFTSDCKYLLSASEDYTVRLWDLETHTNRVSYRGHSYPIWDMDTSSTGGYFATASQDRTSKLWITDRIYPIRSFTGHTLDVDCVKFHPNCNYIATGSSDKTVRLWTLQDGKSVRLMHGHRGAVMALAFSPNGTLLASAGDDKRVRVWDLSTGTLYKEFRGHTDIIHTLSFSSDSSMLASGGMDCTIKVWDVRKGTSSSSLGEGGSSTELLGSYPTKSAPVIYLNFSKYNLLQAAGAV